jgi:hypothetical protein
MPSPKRSLARALTTQPTKQTNRNTKPEGTRPWPDPLKNSRTPSKTCEAPDRGRGGGDPGARPVAHAPGAPPAQRLPSGSHQGLVYDESPGRSERREHGLVRIVLVKGICTSSRRQWSNLLRDRAYTVTPSVPCGSTGPDSASPSFHVSSGLVDSSGQPFDSTKRNHAPAICEVTTAVITSVV